MENKFKDSFVQDVLSYVQGFWGDEIEVAAVLCCVDGRELTGIVGKAAEGSIVPVVYLEDISSRVSAEKTARIIVKKMRAMTSGIPLKRKHTDKSERGSVLKNVVLRAAGKNRSRLLLRENVHFSNTDIVGFFYLEDRKAYISSEKMDYLELTMEELLIAACTNTLSQFGVTMTNITDFARSFPAGTILQPEPFASVAINPRGLYLLTNSASEGGAALILIPPMLDVLGKMFGGDYYITPKSTDEVLVSSVRGMFSPQLLVACLRAENRKMEKNQPDRILSDHLYRYDSQTKKLAAVQL